MAFCRAVISNERDAVKALTSIDPEANAENQSSLGVVNNQGMRIEPLFFLHHGVSRSVSFEVESFCHPRKLDDFSFVLMYSFSSKSN